MVYQPTHEKYTQAILEVLTWNNAWPLTTGRARSWCGVAYNAAKSKVLLPTQGFFIDKLAQERVSRLIAAAAGTVIDWEPGEEAAANVDFVTFSRAVWSRAPESGGRPTSPSYEEKAYMINLGIEQPFTLRDKIKEIIFERGRTWGNRSTNRKVAKEKAWNVCRPLLWKMLVYNQATDTDEESLVFDPALDPTLETLFSLVWNVCSWYTRRCVSEPYPTRKISSPDDGFEDDDLHSPSSTGKRTRKVGRIVTPTRSPARLARVSARNNSGANKPPTRTRSNAPSPFSARHVSQEVSDEGDASESSAAGSTMGKLGTLSPRPKEQRNGDLDPVSLYSVFNSQIATSSTGGSTTANTRSASEHELKLAGIKAYHCGFEGLNKWLGI